MFVDSSIKSKDDPNYNKYSQNGFSGCGGILVSKETNVQTPHTLFRMRVHINDPDLAEHTHTKTQKEEFSVLCDCKGAVKCMNHQHSMPYHYSEICQKIQEQKTQLTKKVNELLNHMDARTHTMQRERTCFVYDSNRHFL